VDASAVAVRLGEPAGLRGWRPSGDGPARALAGLAVLSAVSAAGTVAAPGLWDRPLLLVALSPRLPFLLHASGSTSWWALAPVALVRLLVADPLHYALGRHGAVVGRRLRWPARLRDGRAHRLGARLAALVGRSLPVLVLVRPVGRHVAAAGAARTPPGLVALADVAGTVAYLVAVLVGGHAWG
jgi:hypothetical protein